MAEYYLQRAHLAEESIREIAAQAKINVAKLGAHSVLLEAAMHLIVKHDLLSEFAQEVGRRPEKEDAPSASEAKPDAA